MVFFIVLFYFELLIDCITSVMFSLLLLTCLLWCTTYFEKVCNCDLIASCSTLLVGYEFVSDATYLISHFMRCIVALLCVLSGLYFYAERLCGCVRYTPFVIYFHTDAQKNYDLDQLKYFLCESIKLVNRFIKVT